MANWCGTARSNNFRVKDVKAFQEALAPFDIEVQVHPAQPQFVMLVGAQEYGDFPSCGFTEDDEEIELDFQKLFAEHLVDGQVAILMEAGAEKLRYITGYACAYTWDGRTAQVTLSDIYQLIEEDLGVPARSYAAVSYNCLPECVATGLNEAEPAAAAII